MKADFLAVRAAHAARDVIDVGGGDPEAVLEAEQILQQDSRRVGQARNVADAAFLECGEAVDLVVDEVHA